MYARIFNSHGILWRLCLCLGLCVGVVQSVEGANYTYRFRMHNASGVFASPNVCEGGDGAPSTYWTAGNIAAGAYTGYQNVNTVAEGTTVYARTKPNSGSFGGWVSIGTVQAGTTDFTVEWNDSSSPVVPTYTNYTASFCITNTTTATLYFNPGYTTADGVFHPLVPSFTAYAPGQGDCFSITSSVPFVFIYGDPLYTEGAPHGQGSANTNVSYSSLPTSGTSQSGSIPPIVGNSGQPNGLGGQNATGSTNPLTQLDYRQGIDALIRNSAAQQGRVEGYLGQIATNTAAGTNADYSGLLERIRTNTQAQADSTLRNDASNNAYAQDASGFATNRNTYTYLTNQLPGPVGDIGTMRSGGFSLSNDLNGIDSAILATPPSGFGQMTLSNNGVAVYTVDFGAALDGSLFDGFIGAGWRVWLRILLSWVLFTGAVVLIVADMRKAMWQLASVPSFQINANATGAFAFLGGNVALRIAMLPFLIAILALMPSLIVVISTSIIAAVHAYVGSGPTTIAEATSASGMGALSNVPSMIKQVLYKINVTWPLLEGVIIGGNLIVARMIIDPLVGLWCYVLKLFGV